MRGRASARSPSDLGVRSGPSGPVDAEAGRAAASAAWWPVDPVGAGARGRSGAPVPWLRSSGDRLPEIGSDIGGIPSRRRAEARQSHPAGSSGAPTRAQSKPARGAEFINEDSVQFVTRGPRPAAGGEPAVRGGQEGAGGDERGRPQHVDPGPSQRRHPGPQCTCPVPCSRAQARPPVRSCSGDLPSVRPGAPPCEPVRHHQCARGGEPGRRDA
jgi:hypothetical protein